MEPVLDDELVPGLKHYVMNPTRLNVPGTINTAGNRNVLGAIDGTSFGTNTD